MAGISQVATRPDRPVLIYDGECTFCRYWVQRWHQIAREQFDYLAAQTDEVKSRYPELSAEALAKEVHFVEPDGRVSKGADAVFRALGSGGRGWRWAYEHAPGFAPASESAYRLVAKKRQIFSWLTRIGWGAKTLPPKFVVTRWLFLRGLGLCYLVAFWSLWVQVNGLVGSKGIMPVADQLVAMEAQAKLYGVTGKIYWLAPTLSWLHAGDVMLWGQCVAGLILALGVIAGFLTGPCLLLLWILYLSLVTACGVFLGYQWDNLLLEVGLLSLLVAPWRLVEGWKTHPPPLGRWLMLLLLFRIIFSSGCVKLVSLDQTWRGLTALQYHYQTQPLPTALGWYVHQLPHWFHTCSAILMFSIELVVPFLIFGPRRLRLVAFYAFLALMLLIGLTGNYGFFNLITIVLCLWLVDDQSFLQLVPARWRSRWVAKATAVKSLSRPWPWWEIPRRVVLGIGVAVVTLTAAALLTGLFGKPWPSTALWFVRTLAPLRSFNHYGLFAVMTTTRPEIVVEGSQDGTRWEPYEFKYKAGDLTRAPVFAGLHMPRLDWQMWFAALEGDYQRSSWFVGFALRLLEGSPAVSDLLERNPFPKEPPRYLRARLYEYRFTTRAERARTGAWWERRLLREYCPAISVRERAR